MSGTQMLTSLSTRSRIVRLPPPLVWPSTASLQTSPLRTTEPFRRHPRFRAPRRRAKAIPLREETCPRTFARDGLSAQTRPFSHDLRRGRTVQHGAGRDGVLARGREHICFARQRLRSVQLTRVLAGGTALHAKSKQVKHSAGHRPTHFIVDF